MNENTMKNHNELVTKYFKVWTDAKGGMKQGKDLSEEGNTEREYIRQQIKTTELEAANARWQGHVQAKIEDRKTLILDHQLKQQRMFNRSFLSVMGSGGSFFESIKALLKTTDTFSPYGDMLRLMHLDPSTKAKIEQARTSHDPMAQATASSLAANEGVNLSNAMAAQTTILGKILKKIDKVTPNIQTPRGMAMAGLGIAGVGLLTKAFRKALDSSPMLKQMAKLLDFGVMLLLRPIGDFFGFLFRPILILLLRKFIIPFYQEYMPLMRKMGNDIGKFMAGGIDVITNPMGLAAIGGIIGSFVVAKIISWKAALNKAVSPAFPKDSYWRKVANALTLKGSFPKLPKLELQIPK